MADAFVSFAVQKLGDFLMQEVSLRQNLRENVLWLSNELRFMRSFLKDAEEKQVDEERVQQLIFEINSIANDAVAILETYSFISGSASRLKACACLCRKETKFYNVGKEIQSLKERIIDISRKRETYGIRDINTSAGEGPSNYRPNNQRYAWRRTTSYLDDQDQIFVGFQDVVESLLAEILKEEPRRSVISIYGMGGLGKTTLARNLYHSRSLIDSFDTRAWICVSQQYNTPDLLRRIIKSIRGRNNLETSELGRNNLETAEFLERINNEEDLEIHLRDLLEEKKYLVVVDDLWHVEAWESLKRAFPDSNKGSRIIITTRKKDVAEKAKGFVHKLRFQTEEESWDLFRKKLLDVRAMVPAMESLARDMVGKCAGLPLAVAVLSGLLSHKKGLEEWRRVKAHLWGRLIDDSIEICDILSLSYNDLPMELKQCFLYFGIFPEDFIIRTKEIVWMWVAEGFIPRGEERMEDVAVDFLNELIRRNLIQVTKTFWDEVTECMIHDLLRDLAVKKASEVNFFAIYDHKNHTISSSCLRHVIHDQAQRYLLLDFPNLKLRSVAFFDGENKILDKINFHKKFQHLYVLHLENCSGTLPTAIESLYHLKYLSMTGPCEIPPSIGKLKNLQTLHAMGSNELPPEISNLKNVRHLISWYSIPLQRINKLTNLQVLDVSCDQWKYVNPVDLVNLQYLSMASIERSYSLNNISSLKNLTILSLECSFDNPFPALEFLSCCQNLQKLRLDGRIEKLPLFPESITMMAFSHSFLKEDPMPILGRLPNLRDLSLLWGTYEGKEMRCNDNSFPQLEFLLLELEKVERWELATSAMPLLKSFSIRDCPNLGEIPQRIKDLPILKISDAFRN